jgi:hypothetical protein
MFIANQLTHHMLTPTANLDITSQQMWAKQNTYRTKDNSLHADREATRRLEKLVTHLRSFLKHTTQITILDFSSRIIFHTTILLYPNCFPHILCYRTYILNTSVSYIIIFYVYNFYTIYIFLFICILLVGSFCNF